MKIILVGCGKVGTALARQLSEEGHNVTIIDTNKARVEHISEAYDVMGITGNGSSITTLSEAGIEEADVFIAVTGSDELNLLCCMFAKKAGHCHAIARVRNPSYSHELDFIKKQIGISAIINPEMAAAREISHLLRFPGASKIDTFAEGRVRLIKFTLTEAQALDGVAIREIPTRLKSDILVCAVERNGGVIIPTVILCSRPAISHLPCNAGKGPRVLPAHPSGRAPGAQCPHRGRRCHCLLPEPGAAGKPCPGADRGAGPRPLRCAGPGPARSTDPV